MSQYNDEGKTERSIKLCQLIQDRQIDKEIGPAIRKLLEVVDIDFQDQNRHKKTATHLAVEKCDVTCVKFLLQFRPNLEVKDEDGKTPVELAESKGDQIILNALMNSTVDVVNESHVEVIEFRSLTPQKVEAISSRSAFKVLKLTYCPSVKEAWMKLNDQGYRKALNESSHLFFIAIQTNETNIQNYQDLMKKALNLRKPLIVQLTTLKSKQSKIYFKDDESDFVEITETPQITQEEFNEAVESKDECNFKLLVAALRSNLFGHFTGDLLGTKLNMNQDRSEAVNQFAKSNALCHRFFKLFDENLVDECQSQIDRIVSTFSFRGDQSLLALLDLPFEPKDGKLELNENQQGILSVVDSSGYNLLMMAAKQENWDALKLLLRFRCDFNHSDDKDKRASDICWEIKAFDYLAELIEAGSPYPNNFCVDKLKSSEAYKRINRMIEATNSFHKNIKQGKADEVEKFIASHPNIKHAYDSANNKSALTVALQSKQGDICSTLLKAGFRPGVDDEYCTVLDKFESKEQLPNWHRIDFKKALDEPHLKRLLKKCRLSRGSKDRAKCSRIIRRMFDVLNENKVEIVPILQICSLSKTLQIIFDFNCDSVVDMDPSRNTKCLGLTYPDGFVYVGAAGAKNNKKPKEFFEVIGNLIHELVHHAIKLTYENGFKPYKVGDEKEFETIATEIKQVFDKSPDLIDTIVSTAFSYKKEEWHAELIARVSHLLAQRKHKTDSEALIAAERNLSKLFTFYRETTLKDVEKESKVLLQKYLIDKINNQAGIAQKIENLNVNFKNVTIDLKPSSVNVVASNAPQLTLAMLGQVYPPNSHIFVTLEQIAIGNILGKIAKTNAKGSSTTLIVDCIGQTQEHQKNLRKLLQGMKNVKTIALVMAEAEAESSRVKENFSEVEFQTFNHKWDELKEDTKVNLLNKKVIFQGFEMKLNELVKPSSEAMNFFPLGELLDCKKFQIGHELHQGSHKFYIPRKFIEKGQANATTFDELSQVEPKMGAMIISDDAGSGKSVALFEIAESLHDAFPDQWVQFIDLKRHIEAFKSVEDHKMIKSLEDFIVQNILKNEAKFDSELFVQMFQEGKTIVLFDGFDEICPNYKDLLEHVLKLFKPASGNQFFITTRPHLEADLEGALGKFVFKLEKFSEESQKSFLREHWRSVGFEISHEDFEVLSTRLFEKFCEISFGSNVVGLPLLLRMTAEIFDEPIKENFLNKVDSLSIASVFRQFVVKYFLRWTIDENEISRSETVEFQMAGGVLEVHHRIALNHFFDNQVLNNKFVRFEVDQSDAEKISRVGLIRYHKTEKTFQFVHQTFVDYFVADFIWFHLNRKNRDPSHECSKAIEVLDKVLSNCRVIRTFLDQTLEAMKFSPSEAFCKSVAKSLSEVLKSKNHCKNPFDFMTIGLYTSAGYLANLLLSVIKHVDKKVLLKALQPKPIKFSVLHDAANFGRKASVSTLCDIITTCIDNPKEVFRNQEQDQSKNGNILLRAARNQNVGVLTTLCENLISVFKKDEIKIMFQQKDNKGRNIIAIASQYSSDKVFSELLSLLPDYFSLDEIKCLVHAVGRNQNIFYREVARDFGIDEKKNILYQPATAPNMFCLAARNKNEKIFGAIIDSTSDVLSSDEIKSMLMQKDSKGSNVLHYIAGLGNVKIWDNLNSLLRKRSSDDKWNKLISFAQTIFSNDEMMSFLSSCNDYGENCLHVAVSGYRIENMIEAICETIKTVPLSVKDQKKIVRQKDFEGKNVFHHAAARFDRFDCKSLYDALSATISKDEIGEMLKEKDSAGNNILCTFSKVSLRTRSFDFIIFLQDILRNDEFRDLLFDVNHEGQNFFHCRVKTASLSDIEFLGKAIKQILSREDQKILFGIKSPNVFHLAAKNPFSGIFSTLHECLKDVLTESEMKSLIQENNSENENTLHSICHHDANDYVHLLHWDIQAYDKARLLDFLKVLKVVCDAEEIKKIVTSSDSNGSNCLLLAAQFKDKIFLDELFSFLLYELCIDDRRNLIREYDKNGRNIFNCASLNEFPEILSIVEHWAGRRNSH